MAAKSRAADMKKVREARKKAGCVYWSVQVLPEEKEALKLYLKQIRANRK